MSNKISQNHSIESQLQKLTQIVEALESDELSLEDSLKQFEEGINLTKTCQQSLEASEKRVTELLTKD